jgi:hypothetical protein
LLSLAGIVAGSFITAAPAQADPPRHAPAYGWRNKDDRKDDRRDRKEDRREDKRDHKGDRKDDRRDGRDDRRDGSSSNRWGNRDDNRYGSNSRYHNNTRTSSDNRYKVTSYDTDRDGTPNRYDRFPTDPRRH